MLFWLIARGNFLELAEKLDQVSFIELIKILLGLLIIAKNDKAHIEVSRQIKEHEVKKTYRALVRGRIKENSGTIDMPISRSKNDRTKMAVEKNGKNAVTHFVVLERFQDYTYVEVNIETGRTHQIRVHFSKIGFPIVGDEVYSNGKNPFGVSRTNAS